MVELSTRQPVDAKMAIDKAGEIFRIAGYTVRWGINQKRRVYISDCIKSVVSGERYPRIHGLVFRGWGENGLTIVRLHLDIEEHRTYQLNPANSLLKHEIEVLGLLIEEHNKDVYINSLSEALKDEGVLRVYKDWLDVFPELDGPTLGRIDNSSLQLEFNGYGNQRKDTINSRIKRVQQRRKLDRIKEKEFEQDLRKWL